MDTKEYGVYDIDYLRELYELFKDAEARLEILKRGYDLEESEE